MALASQPNVNDPVYKNFLAKVVNDYGMDPNQTIDMNDPMTKLTMTIVMTNIEQGRSLYSYDQYIKGCANSIGIDPAVFDSEINPTSLGFENNSGNAGYVPPTLPSVRKGGSTIPLNPSTYITVGINAALAATGGAGFPISLSGSGGLFSGISGSIPGSSTPFSNFGGVGAVSSIPGTGAVYSASIYNGNDAAILATIRQTETNGNYGAVNYTAVAVGFPKSIDMSNMTLAEVRDYQRSMLNAGADSSAIGPYQMIGTTLDSYASKAGISPDTKMTPEVWDKIGSAGVTDALARSGGDISKVPVVWYSGNPNGTGVAPATMAAYQQKWLNNYQTQAAKVNSYDGQGANPNSGPNQYPPGFDSGSATKTTNADGSITYTDKNNQVYTLQNGTWIDPGKNQVVGVATTSGGQILAYPQGVNDTSYQVSNPDGTKTFVASSGDSYILKDGKWFDNQGSMIGSAGGSTASLTAAPDTTVVAKGLGIDGQLTVTTQTNADGSFRYATYTDTNGNKFWIDNKGSVTAAIDENGNAIPQSQRQIAQFNSMGTFNQMPSSIDPNNAPLPPRQFADVPLPPTRPTDLASDGFTRPTDPSGAMLAPDVNRLAPSVKDTPTDTSDLSSSASLKIAQSRVDAASANLSKLESGGSSSLANANERAAAAQEYNDAVIARDQIQNNTPTIQSRELMTDGTVAVTETPVTLGYGFNNPGMQNTTNVPVGPIDVVPSYNEPTYGTTGPNQPVGFNTVSFGSTNSITPQGPSPLAYTAPGSNFTTGSSVTLYGSTSGGAVGMSMTNNGSLIVPTPAPEIPVPTRRPSDLPMDNSLPAGNTVFPADQRQSNSMMGTASTPNYPDYSKNGLTAVPVTGPSAMIMQPDGTLVKNGLTDGTIAGGSPGQVAAPVVPVAGATPPNQLIQEINVQQNANAAERTANYDKFDKLDAELKNNPDLEPGRVEAIRQEQIGLAEKNLDLVNRDIALEDQKTALASQPEDPTGNSPVNTSEPGTVSDFNKLDYDSSQTEAAVPQGNQTYAFGSDGATYGSSQNGGFGLSGVTSTTGDGTTNVAQGSTTFSPEAGGASVAGSTPAGGAASPASPGGAAAAASSAAGMPQGC